jgi:hypothetical protein
MAIHSDIWTPLDDEKNEFRVFLLEPSQDPFQSPSGRLLVCSESDHDDYDALSYAWAVAGDFMPVHIGGYRHLVTGSLANQLRKLRMTDTSRAFWIDTICINQFDDA